MILFLAHEAGVMDSTTMLNCSPLLYSHNRTILTVIYLAFACAHKLLLCISFMERPVA